MRNTLTKTAISLTGLAGALQDMHHYCLLILQPQGHPCSTFEGGRDYRGLIGKLHCYGALHAKVVAFQLDDFPDFCELSLPDVESIDSVAALRTETTRIWKAVQMVCRDNSIDGYSGHTFS